MPLKISRIDDISTPWLEILLRFGFSNQPFILGSWSTSNWPAVHNWVLPDGKPNTEFLKRNYGNSVVPILVNGNEYKSTKLSDFIDNMKNPGVYLKDWHFQNEYGTSMYNLHPFFSRDFVNCEAWTTDKNENPFGDDYRFVYIGGAGSWTKFHADVACSHSWSANICGRKKWFMMPPGSEEFFKCTSSESGYVEDIRCFQDLFDQAKVFTFIQEPGEIVFVPSNWYHQVHNLVDTISINHNWVNSTNLNLIYEFLNTREEDVKNELRDCFDTFSREEYDDKVEDILFVDARLNHSKFRKLCKLVQQSRTNRNFSYRCDNHGSNTWQCIATSSCYPSIASICTCSTSLCTKCSSFINNLEYSVVSRFL